MQRRAIVGSILALLALGTACQSQNEGTSPAEPSSKAPAPSPAAPSTASAPVMPHGGHEPHHGGVVLMVMDLHFEVVLDPAGHHKVYWSNAARQPVPASTIQAVSMTVKRAGAPPEQLTLTRDPTDAFWIANGQPLPAEGADVDVTFNRPGEPPATMQVPRTAATEAGHEHHEEGHEAGHEAQHEHEEH